MALFGKLAQYRAWRAGVKHCTFDPEGAGVVRIHLVPPRPRLFGNASYVVILNGYYLLPLGYSWAILLSHFMDAVNRYDGKELDEAAERDINRSTLRAMHKSYPGVPTEEFSDDLHEMLGILFDVAHGGTPDADIDRLSIRAYARNMTAPHRMDLMVSAMTDDKGAWKCNQRCLFCYAAGQALAGTRELTTDEWKDAIDRLHDANVPMLTFTGGEPLLRPDIAELVAHARTFVTRLNTNGVLLTDETVNALRRASLDSLQVTLYSHDAAVHNSLVGASHFADTVAGIRRAVDAGLDLSVNTPLCRKNRDYIQTLAFIHSLGVRYVTVSGLICTGTAAHNHGLHDLSNGELLNILKAAKAYCDAHGMEMDFTSPGLVPEGELDALGLHTPACGAALSNMAICPDGRVVPCQSWLSSDASLGNILTDRFSNIWKHPLCRRLRAMSEQEAQDCPLREQEGRG